MPVASIVPNGHTTSPPARYTEASLVKRLEELGIGRPSTWASIIQTIQDRGYVWKKGQALVPTWTAFAVIRLLEEHFNALVDYDFTASIDADLDEIAHGTRAKDKWLKRFYFGDTGDGDTQPISAEAGFGEDALLGLKRLVEENLDEIDAAEINTFPLGADVDGNVIVVKPGKYGPYVKRGEDTASVPDDLAPDELTVEKAIELLAAPKIGRADRRTRRLPRVREERPLRAVRAVGRPRRSAPRLRQAEDGEPVQDDGPRTDDDGRGRSAAPVAAAAR